MGQPFFPKVPFESLITHTLVAFLVYLTTRYTPPLRDNVEFAA